MERIVMNFFMIPNAEQNPSSPHLSQHGLRSHQQLVNQFKNRVIERNYGIPFLVDYYANGIRVSVGIGFKFSSSNMALELRTEYPSSISMPPVWRSFPHNPFGVAIGYQRPIQMTRERANNPDWQLQIQLTNGQKGQYISMYTTNEILYRKVVDPAVGLGTYYSSLFPYTHQRGTLGLGTSRHEMTVLRNATITMKDNRWPSTELQLGSLFNPTNQGNRNRSPQWLVNRIYNPPNENDFSDPHMRALILEINHNHGGSSSSSGSN